MVSGLRVMGGAAGRRRTEPSAMQGTALLFVSSIAMTLAFSRGIFDLYGAQILGYLLQYASLGILALTTFWRAVVLRERLPLASQAQVAVASAFLMFACISWAFTVLRTGQWEGVIYVGVMTFWTFYIVAMGVGGGLFTTFPLEKVLALPLLANVAVGILEHSRGLGMPGSSVYEQVVRPAGLTGSMQHYAIALAIGSLYYLQVFLSTRRGTYVAASLVLLFGAAASLTRSGYLIIAVALALLFLGRAIRTLLRWKLVRVRLSPLVVGSLLVLLVSAVAAKQLPAFWERATTMLHPGSAGNPERLAAWRVGLQIWLEGPVVVGDAVGVVTQSTAKVLGDVETVNVESGVFQQLVNFGLLGTLAFYGMLLLGIWGVDRRHTVLRAAMSASILQSVVYMSIETVPYMSLLGLGPALSRRLLHVERQALAEVGVRGM